MSFYTQAKCSQIRTSASKLKMLARPDFWTTTPKELAKIFNGCGPDSWIDLFRRFASWVYRMFPEPIAIHDFDFQHSDGNLKTLAKVNKNFLANSRLKLDSEYPLTNVWSYPIRAREWAKMQFAYIALKNGSEKAWKEAHERFSASK